MSFLNRPICQTFPSDTDPTEAQYAECKPIITEAFADDSFPMPSELSQEVKDCCALTAAYYDALTAKTNDFNLVMEWENKDQCCSALEWSDGSMVAHHGVHQPHHQPAK